MAGWKLRFRQIHLDFHTSPDIPGIGAEFDKGEWQAALREGHVDSITVFSKCHHGWSYHPTKVGKMHPHLGFDLLRAQIEACREIGVNTPVYISAGVDNVAAEAHPEWRELSIEGKYQGWVTAVNQPGFHKLCFNTGYLDYLCLQIKEAVRLFPDCHGVFLDIISQNQCCCPVCLGYMRAHGLDADREEDRKTCAMAALERYYRMTTAACRCDNPDMPVFHNSGHIPRGRRDILPHFSHLELESLPTGGWGYDHYPVSAMYVRKLGLDFLGMTGKFHTTWGEFGGYKHPNALRYECAAMLAYGSKCSVGDQLHPSGRMDASTYRLIGAAYAEVAAKEGWCAGAEAVVDIGVLSSEAEGAGPRRKDMADTGAGRVLLEEHFLFDLLDRHMDFEPYKLLILPDAIRLDADLKAKLEGYLARGGRLLLTGESGLAKESDRFVLDVGADYAGLSEDQPDYLECGAELALTHVTSPLVMYVRSHRVTATTGATLARIRAPYFNRTWKHFCSHQHAPASGLTGHPAAIRQGNVLYLAHPVFTQYAGTGAVAHREYAARAIRLLLGGTETVTARLPSAARVTLMRQAAEGRHVLHLLYAAPAARGGAYTFSPEGYVRAGAVVEVIEDLPPLHDVEVTVRLPTGVTRASLEPQGVPLPIRREGDRVTVVVPRFACHQMVAFS